MRYDIIVLKWPYHKAYGSEGKFLFIEGNMGSIL